MSLTLISFLYFPKTPDIGSQESTLSDIEARTSQPTPTPQTRPTDAITASHALNWVLWQQFAIMGLNDELLQAQQVIKCESNWHTDIWSWNHSSYGVAQWTKASWSYINKMRGTSLNYENPYDQLDMMGYAWGKGYQSWWDCVKILKLNK